MHGDELGDLLTNQPPAAQDGDIAVFATATNPEIDRERLSHFALGFSGRPQFILEAGNIPRSSLT
jgi:hypothetical protein